MPGRYASQSAMTLFTGEGERKYLNASERKRFYMALSAIEEPSERTFCETLFWTGCRPSEALALDFLRVQVEDAALGSGLITSSLWLPLCRGRRGSSVPSGHIGLRCA